MKFWQRQSPKLTWPVLAFLLGTLAIASGVLPLRPSDVTPGKALTVRFKDIAASAGVHFVLDNCATPYKYQIEPMVAGVAVFDYNNDACQTCTLPTAPTFPNCKRSDHNIGTGFTATMETGPLRT